MKTTTIHNVIATAHGVDAWLPVLTGQQDLREWLMELTGKTVTTKNGYEMSLVRDTLFRSQMALTNVALSLRAATELGLVPYTHAVSQARKAHDLIERFSVGFAAHRQENHRELVAAEVAIKVKDGCFDELTASGAYYTEEELLEIGYDYEDIENILEAQELAATARNSGDRTQSMAQDEGILRTALHDVNQLWDINLADIEWAEGFTAKVALIGKQWPTANAAWDVVLDRLAESWAAAVEYADDKEAINKKIERRMLALDDLHAKPMYARWAINHVTRRVWRDIKALERTKERFEQQLDRLERQVFAEERYGVPGAATRIGMGEATELERVQYLPFGAVSEADTDSSRSVTNEGISYRDIGFERDLETDTRAVRDRAWFTAVISSCEHQLDLVKPVYAELRALDLSLTKLWELFNQEGAMPSAPPVYWNARGAYLTEEDANNALLIEQAEWQAKSRMADDDAALAAIELMLANK